MGSPLSPEAEALLAGIPETIGGPEPEPGAPVANGSPEPDGEVLMDMIGEELVDDEDLAELLAMVGQMLAKRRKRQAYEKAGVRAGSIAAKPWADVINHLWFTYAPSFLSEMTSTIPGLGKALIKTTIAFGPAVMSDVQATRAERATRGRRPVESPIPTQQPGQGGGPVPVDNRLRPARTTSGVTETI